MSFESTNTHRPRFWLTAIAVSALALAAGIWVGRQPAPDPLPVPGEAQQEPTPGGSEENGVPLGYAQSEIGAVEAATNFTRAMASVPEDPDLYLAAAETISAPSYREEARRLAENGLDFLRDRYGTGGRFSFAPLRYRVLEYSDTGAQVSVWGVTVASGPKIEGIEESWLTATLNLTWISGDWRLAGQTSETGPTPELLQTSDSSDASILDGYQEYDNAPIP